MIDATKARWWTWVGQRANSSLGDALGSLAESRGDDLSIGLDPSRASSEAVRGQLVGLDPDSLPAPSVAEEFAENMKFSDCLPPALALEVARQRLADPVGVQRAINELNPGKGYDSERPLG